MGNTLIETFGSENFRDSATTGCDGAFGCSFTYGTGVHYNEAWPFLLGANNFGLPGSSNDKICRLAIEYIRTYKPKNIFVMWTFLNRREWLDDQGTVLRFKADDVKYRWEQAHLELQNEYWDNYNKDKNILLLENFCVNTNVTLYQLSVDSINHTELGSFGSDNSHPGTVWHSHVAEYFTRQMVAQSY